MDIGACETTHPSSCMHLFQTSKESKTHHLYLKKAWQFRGEGFDIDTRVFFANEIVDNILKLRQILARELCHWSGWRKEEGFWHTNLTCLLRLEVMQLNDLTKDEPESNIPLERQRWSNWPMQWVDTQPWSSWTGSWHCHLCHNALAKHVTCIKRHS